MEQENESQNSDHNIENLISEEAPKKRKIAMKAVITLAIMMIMTIMIITLPDTAKSKKVKLA